MIDAICKEVEEASSQKASEFEIPMKESSDLLIELERQESDRRQREEELQAKIDQIKEENARVIEKQEIEEKETLVFEEELK